MTGPRAPVVEVPEARHHVMLDQPLGFVAALRMGLDGFVRITGWPGREVADRLTRWQKSHTAATAFRRLSSSMLCGSTCVSP
jgi:hypothetical protein